MGLGVPFNIASYSYLTHLIAHHVDMEAGEFSYFLGNAHIYEEHIEALKEQIDRTPYSFPLINIRTSVPEKIDDYELNHIEVLNYQCHSKIKMNMKA